MGSEYDKEVQGCCGSMFLNFSDLKTTKIQYKNLETHIRLPNLLKLIKESIIRKYYYIDHQPHFTEEM